MGLNPGFRFVLLWSLGIVCLVAACTGSSPLLAPDEPAASGSGDAAVETTSAQREQTVDVVGATDVVSSVGDGLTLSEAPGVEELSVEARMRDEADLSRAFDFGCSPPWFHGNASDLAHDVPDAVLATLPADGTHPMVLYCADLNWYISSHPNWEHDSEPVLIDDLHSYVALLQRGRVLEIRQLVTFAEYYPAEGGNISRQVISGIPSELFIDDKSHRSSRALVAFAASHGTDNEHAGWIVWIGGAHPHDGS